MRVLRGIVVVALFVSAFAAPAGADHGEPITNDTVASATLIEDLPFWDALDTSSAVDSTDDAVGCFDHSDYSVWYRYTPAEDATLLLSTLGSEFDTVLEVFEGDASEPLACDDDGGWDLDSRLRFEAVGGQTYLIRAAGFSGDSGYLEFNAEELIPMEATLTVADQGAYRMSNGRAIINAVLTCNQDGYVDVLFSGDQGVGPASADGRRWAYTECGESVPVTVRLNARNGKFLPGPLQVDWSGYACSYSDYGWGWPDVATDDEGVEAMDHEYEGSCADLEGTKSVLLMPTQ